MFGNWLKTDLKTIRQTQKILCCIPKGKLSELNKEITSLKWDEIVSSTDVEYGCNTFMKSINAVRDKFTVKVQRKVRHKNYLPCLKEKIWERMKNRDAALQKAKKSCRDTHRLC